MKPYQTLRIIWLAILVRLAVAEDRILTYVMLEDNQPNYRISNVIRDAGVSVKYTTETFSLLSFSIIEHGSSFDQLFVVDQSGMLTVPQTIDRDVICGRRLKCVISLDIKVQPQQYFEIIKVNVEIRDVNDNAPMFPDESVVKYLPETLTPGSSFTIAAAEDLDSPVFGVKKYELISSSDKFELLQSNGTSDMEDLSIVVNQKLDREMDADYSLRVVAIDGGTPPKSGVVAVSIVVLDSNDNNPIFEKPSYTVNIFENTPINMPILQVKATDRDIGENAEILYSLSRKTQTVYGSLFTVDNTTGDISLIGEIDYEKQKSYTLSIKARNKSPGAFPATTKVTVVITDVNDHPPAMKVHAKNQEVEISEYIKPGSFVTHLTVKDQDTGFGGKFECQLNTTLFALEQLYTTEFKIITNDIYDREDTDKYIISISCLDEGNPPLKATETLTVHVSDENDHSPVFLKSLYTIEMFENNEIGGFVLQPLATDADIGQNSKIRYEISGRHADMVTVDSTTGIISASSVFDFESLDQLEFTINAIDKGVPSRKADAAILVKIIDTDDEDPEFSASHYMFNIKENLPVDSIVGKVTASDSDSDIFSRFIYKLEDDDMKALFRIDPQDGHVYTKQILDREMVTTYSFTVLAESTHMRTASGLTSVTVYVTDENDNTPYLDLSSTTNETLQISGQEQPGQVIKQIHGLDADSDSNGLISYFLKENEAGKYFMIDEQKGNLSIATSMAHLDDTVFEVVVVMKDNGDPPRSTETAFSIIVNTSLPIHGASIFSGQNLTILICVTFVLGLVIVILTLAIVIVFRNHHNIKKKGDSPENKMEKGKLADIASACTNSLQAVKGKVVESVISNVPQYLSESEVQQKKSAIMEEFLYQDKISDTRYPGRSVRIFLDKTDIEKRQARTEHAQIDVHDDRDSDSGCSADVSHTGDSGTGSAEELSDNITFTYSEPRSPVETTDGHFEINLTKKLEEFRSARACNPELCVDNKPYYREMKNKLPYGNHNNSRNLQTTYLPDRRHQILYSTDIIHAAPSINSRAGGV